MWVVMQQVRWESIEIMGVALNSRLIGAQGSTGVLLVFDDYDKALKWVDGEEELICEIREKEV